MEQKRKYRASVSSQTSLSIYLFLPNNQVPIIPVVFSPYSRDGGFYSSVEKRFDSGEITAIVLPEIPTTGYVVDPLC